MRRGSLGWPVGAIALMSATVAARGQLPIKTTVEDFFQGGSQPDGSYEQVLHSNNCGTCHGTFDDQILIMERFQGGMMAQAARDPLFYACLAIAEQDVAFVGDICIRCHAPRAWISGRSTPTDGSAINFSDRDGVNCHFCHRMVDPFYKPGKSPIEDEEILNALIKKPVTIGGGNYVLDRMDRRRGPRPGVAPPHSFIKSPFHHDAALCATCHDVSNPAYSRQPDDTYVLNELETPHPTDDKYDQFPMERTFSEWLNSAFAVGGVDMGGRFGGNKQVVSTCQDCHMPDSTSRACDFGTPPTYDDMAAHDMVGANVWVPDMVANLYPTEINITALEKSKLLARDMLRRAADLELTQDGDVLRARVVNQTGHKLPSGYSEGRRMWLNVVFRNKKGKIAAERGAYDEKTADLTTDDTMVFEAKMGIDAAVAQLTGLPEGITMHFGLNNVIYKDNRIPPRGFTNDAFRQVQAAPAGYGYSEGQFWREVEYVIPTDAVSVEVRLFHQIGAKEYIEFLRDANTTNTAGQTLYDQWEKTGKSPPEEMALSSLALTAFQFGDFDGNKALDLADYAAFSSCLDGPDAALRAGCGPGDLDGDGDVDSRDFARFQARFGPLE